ncbi:hypothetical protein GCM10023336_45480 [Streptomyces similanensis]|uniref:Uncharacterized protein n=1 Tax=Streptomyces similanensis TaxID=1274988 RepID=A0ABP9KT58_9ACTN
MTAWSPEQIARRLPLEFPDDQDMRISHEAIYQALYVEQRGALKRELVSACAPDGRCVFLGHAAGTRRGPTSPTRSSASVPPRPRTAPFPGTGRATSSSG